MAETPKRDVFQKDKKRLLLSSNSTNLPSISESRPTLFLSKKLTPMEEYEHLQRREKELGMELEILRKECNHETKPQSRMELLHEYNDVKDVTQIVLGSLARLKNVSVTELHEQFGLSYVNNEADELTNNDTPN